MLLTMTTLSWYSRCRTTLAAPRLRRSQLKQTIKTMTLRALSRELPVPNKVAYIDNAALAVVTLVNVAELRQVSVGEIATRVSQHLTEQSAPGHRAVLA